MVGHGKHLLSHRWTEQLVRPKLLEAFECSQISWSGLGPTLSLLDNHYYRPKYFVVPSDFAKSDVSHKQPTHMHTIFFRPITLNIMYRDIVQLIYYRLNN